MVMYPNPFPAFIVLNNIEEMHLNPIDRKGEIIMKKLYLQLFVLGAMLAGYAMPVLAGAGGGP